MVAIAGEARVGRRPAFVPPGAVLTAFGRQALNLVARDLRRRGITSLLAPDHYCPTMFVPFQLEGIRVHEQHRSQYTAPGCRLDGEAARLDSSGSGALEGQQAFRGSMPGRYRCHSSGVS